MGLLDTLGNLDDTQTQGLLAAASNMLQNSGPSRTPVGFGQIVGGGLGAYQDSTIAAKKRALEEQHAKNLAAYQGLQMQEMQGTLQDSATRRAHDAKLAALQANYGAGGDPAGMPTTPTMGAPASVSPSLGGGTMPAQPSPQASQTPQPAAPKSAYDHAMEYSSYLIANGEVAAGLAQAEKANAMRPKYGMDFKPAVGADGKLHNYQMSDDGQVRDTGLGVKPEMVQSSLGGTTRWDDKNTLPPGTVFQHTMTPGERAYSAQAAARLKFDKDQAAATDDGALDPLAVHFTAQQVLAGDTSALQNFGRGAQGAQNLKAVRAEVTRMANAQGMTGADLAAKNAEFVGLKAGQRTAGTRSASIEIAANEVAQLAPIALEASTKVARSGFLPFGKAQVMFDSNTNDPNMRQFAMANTALVNAYGQAMARNGTATVSDKDHAREMLATTFDQPSYAAAVAQLQKETRAAQAAPKQVRKDLSDAVSGREVAPDAKAQPTMEAKPTPNASNSGRVLIEHETGKRFKSNGLQWIEVQ